LYSKCTVQATCCTAATQALLWRRRSLFFVGVEDGQRFSALGRKS
jgi:hypothetical protein